MRDEAAQFDGASAEMWLAVKDSHCLAGNGIGDNGKDLIGFAVLDSDQTGTAVNADGNLTSAAEGRKRRAFDSDGKTRGGIVEKCDCRIRRRVILARLNAERTLTSRRTEFGRLQPLAHPLGFVQAIYAGSGQENRLQLSSDQLAYSGIDVAAKLDGLQIGVKRLQLRSARRGLLVPTRAPGGNVARLR